VAIVGVVVGAAATPLAADHALSGGYHWARTTNPANVRILNSLTDAAPTSWRSAWLPRVIADWDQSAVIDFTVIAGPSTPKQCRATFGHVNVCNGTYGRNGVWGSAQYWTRGVHFTQVVVRMNDTYFDDEQYFAQFVPLGGGSASEWRRYTLCQELGHALGLGHNDENNDTTTRPGTCMDYTWNSGVAQSPNQHDYTELESIYAHLDATADVPTGSPGRTDTVDNGMGAPREWGRLVRRSANGRMELYELDLGGGEKVHTRIMRAP